jgi:excinuclease ABC subunit C
VASVLTCFDSVRFEDFGPSRFLTDAPPALGSLDVVTDLKQARRELRRLCPREPGVYGMLDAEGMLLYVGKSKSLLSRLTTYLQTPQEQTKSQHILQHAVRIVWEVWPHEFVALARELELIVRWRPVYNVQGQPGRKRLGWLCVGGNEAAGAYLAAKPLAKRKGLSFGPLPSGGSMQYAVRLLNDCFRLRDCPDHEPMSFADQLPLFPLDRAPGCLRAELGTCLAPCAGGCSRREYTLALRRLKSFLQGDDRSLLAGLETEMAEASQLRDFERAATLRDKLDQLTWLASLLDLLEDARRNYTFAYPIESPSGASFWCLIREGQLGPVVSAPDDNTPTDDVWQHMESRRWWSSSLAGNSLLDLTLLVAHWFQRKPDELTRTIPWARMRNKKAHEPSGSWA